MEPEMGQPEISKTEAAGIPTPLLLQRLRSFGVTPQDLKNEVHQGFLPGPVDGAWIPSALPRARRLLRLRKVGAKGKSLKLLLFLADGWGWDGIRDVCVAGVERVSRLSLNGTERYARAKGELWFSVEDIAEHQHRALIRKVGDRPDLHPTSIETTAFSVGVLRDGAPLKGGTSRRLVAPLLKAAFPGVPERVVDYAVVAFDSITGALDLRIERQIERLNCASPEQVERSRQKIRGHLFFIRKLVKRLGGSELRGRSLNILTFFGNAKEMKDFDFSQGDVKLSATFILAWMIGAFIALDIAFEELLAKLPPWVSLLLRE